MEKCIESALRCLKFIREVEYVTKYKGIIYFLRCENRRARFSLQNQTFTFTLRKISSCKCAELNKDV